MDKKYKKPIIVGIVVLAVVLVMSALSNSTYALFSNDSYGANTNSFSTGMLSIEASSKSDKISLANALPITDEEGMLTNPYVFTIKNIGNLDYLFDVKLLSTGDSSTTFSSEYIKLQIDDGDVIRLSDLTNGVIKGDITLLAGSSIDISVRVWLSIDTPNTELGKSFNSRIVTDGQAVYTSTNSEYRENAASHITSLYTSADKTVVTNNGIDYNYATSVSLMNDRLGGTTDDDDLGNIRYYGADPDNYIYFNCYDYENQSAETCELWRIIGVFEGKVKIIREDLLGHYPYNFASSDSNWSDATLNTILNDAYYNSGSVTYYDYDNEDGATVSFANNGIKIGTRNGGFVSSTTWYINAVDNDSFPNAVYTSERTGTGTWTGKIGLAYASDYGYAADLNSCGETLYGYDDNSCTSVNWLTSVFSLDSSYWLLNPYHSFPDKLNVYFGCVDMDFPQESYGVIPVLYLESDVTLNSIGDGSEENPYQLSQSKSVPATDISNFNYVLGSDTPILSEMEYDGYTIYFNDIELEENEVLLLEYTGTDTNVSVPDTYVIDGTEYNVTILSYYYYFTYYDDNTGDEVDISFGTFYANDIIESVFLDDNIKFIYDFYNYGDDEYYTYENNAKNLFSGCSNLKYASLPNTIKEMDYTFYKCTSLVTVPTIPSSVTSMSSTFSGCTSLVNAPTIPSSVTNMNGTFSGCTNLTGTVRINSTKVSNVTYIFHNTSKAITVQVPSGSTTYTKLNALTTTNGKPSNVTISTFTS